MENKFLSKNADDCLSILHRYFASSMISRELMCLNELFIGIHVMAFYTISSIKFFVNKISKDYSCYISSFVIWIFNFFQQWIK